MSNRVVAIVSRFTPDYEVYSVDEQFLLWTDFEQRDLTAYAHELKNTVLQWLGLPVCVGIEDNTRNGILCTLSHFLRLSQVVPIEPSPQNHTGTRISSRQNSGSFIDSFKWDIFDVWQYSF